MPRILKIICTNWIHFPGLYVMSYFSGYFFKMFDPEVSETWVEIIVSNLYVIPKRFIFTDRVFITIGILIFFAFMDTLLFSIWKTKINRVLIIQCIVLALTGIIKFPSGGLWYVVLVSLFITQSLRKGKIEKIVTR